MVGRWSFLILTLYLSFIVVTSDTSCKPGFNRRKKECIDIDECDVEAGDVPPCPGNASCFNTNGSYYCQCRDGFRSSTNEMNFTGDTPATCKDINECLENTDLCGPNAKCENTIPHYSCFCEDGFISSTGVKSFQHGDNVTCRDICMINKTICGNGTCLRGASGHYCTCNAGFTDYGNEGSKCTALNCDVFNTDALKKEFQVAQDLVVQLKKSCLNLMKSKKTTEQDGDHILTRLLTVIDNLLSGEPFKDNEKVSIFLYLMENALRFIGSFIKSPGTTRSTNHTELNLLVHRGADLPQGDVTLSSKKAQVGIRLETAAGDPSNYPGFTTASLLTYGNLEDSADGFFSGMKPEAYHTFKINSKVSTVTVSNRETSHLKEPVMLTFQHLNQTGKFNHTCVFWDSSDKGGTWSPRGCSVVESNTSFTVCSCNHLSSFAVLMALYEIKDQFELQLITWVGLSLSLVCLFICILTFSLIRSIQSPRTSIHLHLSISLFIAIIIFLAGISQTENQVGCAVVAGLLHFFFLAAFCWMCLEGIQLFRMVVLVFNTNFKTLYMMVGGYGVPAVIVGISALVYSKGYGTERHCWLDLKFIWSFFGPACVIIVINIFFFLITVWKLAQKFSSLNPDLNNLQKIKAFIITAVAQLCVLGTMWIFGSFQFEERSIAMSYLFTIFGSLQGVMLFVMHCLFSKQVREEYGNILSRLYAPKKKSYSEFSCSHSSKAHASKSTQDTGDSHV